MAPERDAVLIAHAHEAEQLLEGEVFKDAYAGLEDHYIEEWLGAEDVQAREMCRAKMSVLQDFRGQLRIIVSRGEYALITQKNAERQ